MFATGGSLFFGRDIISVWFYLRNLLPVNRGRGKKEEEEKEACRNGQEIRFLNAGDSCHVQVNYLGRKHNNYSTMTTMKLD